MLPPLNLSASLPCLLGELRPCFTAPGFATFCGLGRRACRAALGTTRWIISKKRGFDF